MNFEFNYYEILGVQSDANEEEIKKAYEGFKQKKQNGVSKWQSLQVENAFKVLSDQKIRDEYDTYRSNKGKEPASSEGFSKKSKSKSNNILTYILIVGLVLLGGLNFFQMNKVSSLQKQLESFEYETIELRHLQNSRITELQSNIDSLKNDVQEINDVQRAVYGLNSDSSTASYNIDKLKDAHNDLVNYIKCLGESFCYPRGKLVTLY